MHYILYTFSETVDGGPRQLWRTANGRNNKNVRISQLPLIVINHSSLIFFSLSVSLPVSVWMRRKNNTLFFVSTRSREIYFSWPAVYNVITQPVFHLGKLNFNRTLYSNDNIMNVCTVQSVHHTISIVKWYVREWYFFLFLAFRANDLLDLYSNLLNVQKIRTC